MGCSARNAAACLELGAFLRVFSQGRRKGSSDLPSLFSPLPFPFLLSPVYHFVPPPLARSLSTSVSVSCRQFTFPLFFPPFFAVCDPLHPLFCSPRRSSLSVSAKTLAGFAWTFAKALETGLIRRSQSDLLACCYLEVGACLLLCAQGYASGEQEDSAGCSTA